MAVRGAYVDAHDLVGEAAAAGAVAAIVERPLPDVGLPQLVVDRSPAALADAAAWWFGDPSHELGVVGITGTDGKTTTSFLAVAALEAAGVSSGLDRDGRHEDRREPRAEPGAHDDAGAPELQRALRAMVRAGNTAAVVETTSHGLAADRVAGDRVRRGDPDEPQPRAPRIPRVVGGVPGRETVALRAPRRVRAQPAEGRAGLAEDRDRQRRRSDGRLVRRRRPGGRRPDRHVRDGPGRRCPRDAQRGGRSPAPRDP